MPRIISIVNQKGGVGKTTTVINVGAALAELGKKVLLVDFDPQGNLSAGLDVSPELIEQKNTYNCLVAEEPASKNIVETKIPNLHIVPADTNLAGAEIELVGVMAREFRLKNSISQSVNNYDFILIDCPPSLGLLTLNALCASSSYIVPLQTEFFALQGLTHILRTTELVKKHLNKDLVEDGILLTMFDSRSNLSKQVFQEVKGFAGSRVFNNVIPRRVRLAESTSHGVPGVVYDPTCFGVRSYVEVAKEFLDRVEGREVVNSMQPLVPPDPVDRLVSQPQHSNSETNV
jgi:chromosome partitioning protein